MAEAVWVLYGGSTKPGNIAEIMQQPDIDDALIGGAALDGKSYGEMVRITSEVYQVRRSQKFAQISKKMTAA